MLDLIFPYLIAASEKFQNIYPSSSNQVHDLNTCAESNYEYHEDKIKQMNENEMTQMSMRGWEAKV